ncbi:inositol-3-phosphate synthase [Streptomyces sp. NPDC002588]|uniref:inositol-3-phosphate synthase n=1 Tax=Streptomyces sp. NPDC002588 TaxID=3154419 RepID=UPI00331EE5CF
MENQSIRVALAGAGSCASSFVQAVVLARQRPGLPLTGVTHERIGGYALADIEFVQVFEADADKVGRDLADALAAPVTVAVRHVVVPPTGVVVEAGPALDGVAGRLADVVRVHPDCAHVTTDDLVEALRRSGAQVLVCFLPTGSVMAVQAYARACAEAGVAFVNATPEAVANDPGLARLFAERGVPLLGDDLRSHLGATTLHTALLELLLSRNLRIKDTYQLNVGGNTDFLNLSDPVRSASKQKSKRRALASAGIDASEVSAGPNGYVRYLGDRKVCFLRIEADSLLGAPVAMEIRLEVEDSPNAAAVVANAVRAARAAADQGLHGVIDPVCGFLFKSPRTGMPESEGLQSFREFAAKAQPLSGEPAPSAAVDEPAGLSTGNEN